MILKIVLEGSLVCALWRVHCRGWVSRYILALPPCMDNGPRKSVAAAAAAAVVVAIKAPDTN